MQTLSSPGSADSPNHPSICATCSSLRIFAFSRFDVKQKLSLGWKDLSGKRKATEDLLELGFPPGKSGKWECGALL